MLKSFILTLVYIIQALLK